MGIQFQSPLMTIDGFPVAGSVVSVKSVIEHFGVVSDRATADGTPTVIHNVKNLGVRETSWAEFQGNWTHPTTYGIPLNGRSPAMALEFARQRLMGKRYRVGDYNCEHFWREAYGFPLESPQVSFAWKVAGVGVGVASVIVAVTFAVLTQRGDKET